MFAGYRILRLLGSGGMGEVYLAEHPRLPRRDALKILPTDISANTDFRQRFQREAHLAAKLWHPNIVGVHDCGEFDGQLWISMHYVDGLDAAKLLTSSFPTGMPVKIVVEVVTAIASALDYAHGLNLLHRDVKPANIMLTHDGNDGERQILLADFGIARNINDINGLTATNMTVGTVGYSAPKQLMGEEIDGRADQYALAATAYHLLAGRRLFPDSNPVVVISKQLNADPPALADIKPRLSKLDPVLAVALAKEPGDRFASCAEFARAMAEQCATGGSISPVAPTVAAEVVSEVVEHSAKSDANAGNSAKPRSGLPKAPRQPEPSPSRLSTASTTREQPIKWWMLFGTASVLIVIIIASAVIVAERMATDQQPDAMPTRSATPESTSASNAPTSDPPPTATTYAVPSPDPNRVPQGNCPPACTKIPDSAWISPSQIPLYDQYSWPSLAPLTEAVSDPRLTTDEMCAGPPMADDIRPGMLASRIMLPNPPGQWQLQVQILHWRGDPWIAGQRASAVMDSAASLLRRCSSAIHGVSVSRIAEQNVPGHPGQSLTAVITVNGSTPEIAYEYLVSDLRSSTVVEITMWSTSPSAVEWSPVQDDQLLADMVAPLCTAYVNSCAFTGS